MMAVLQTRASQVSADVVVSPDAGASRRRILWSGAQRRRVRQGRRCQPLQLHTNVRPAVLSLSASLSVVYCLPG